MAEDLGAPMTKGVVCIAGAHRSGTSMLTRGYSIAAVFTSARKAI